MKSQVSIGNSKHAEDTIIDRYLQKDEKNMTEVWARVSEFASKEDEVLGLNKSEQNEAFYSIYCEELFSGAGRQLRNCGGTGNGMAGNCFSQYIGDSKESIFDTLKNTALIESMGGGCGVNFSNLRPRNLPVKGVDGISSGPISFIDVFDATIGTISQGGTRRGAFIAILDIIHPDIEEFIKAKTVEKRWNNLNASIAITDDFMKAVKNNNDWDLVWKGEVLKTLNAQNLWHTICEAAWQSAEPGLLFIDTINNPERNPFSYATKLTTVNPCSELPLPTESIGGEPESGMCCLGSLILPNFYNEETKDVNWDLLEKTVHTAIIYLDNLIDQSSYPLPINETTMKKYRQIGLGYVGLADLLLLLGLPYGAYKETLNFLDRLGSFVRSKALECSAELAQQYGPFPAYNAEKDTFGFRRNATLMCCAPTGSLSALYSASWGVEPYYSVNLIRRERLGEHSTSFAVVDSLVSKNSSDPRLDSLRVVIGEKDRELSVEDHISVLAELSKHVGASISKTINLPKTAKVKDVKQAYELAWERGIKGVTVYRDGCRSDQPIVADTEDSDTDDEYDSDEEAIEFVDLVAQPREIPDEGEAIRYKLKYNPTKPSLNIFIVDDEDGPLEIFFSTKDAYAQEYLNGIAFPWTTLFRRGIDCSHLLEIYRQYESPSGGGWFDKKYVPSMLAGIAMVIEKHFKLMGYLDLPQNEIVKEETTETDGKILGEKCPTCGMYTLVPTEGCKKCLSCSYSECG